MKTLMIIDTAHGGMFFNLTYLAAFLLAAGIMIYEGFKKGYPKSTWLLIILSGVIFFIIGDKVFTWSPEQWTQVFTRFHFPEADKKTVLGGIIGLFTGLVLAKTWLRFNRPVLDTLAVALPLSMAISRIGCLMAGCCFGTPTNLPWGIQYDASSWAYKVHLAQGLIYPHDATSLAVHPAQLYQVIGCLFIAFIVWSSRKKWKPGGNLFLFSVLCYGLLRFFVEFVHAPESNFFTGQFFWGLKVIQWLIMGAILPGLLILILRESKAKQFISFTQAIYVSELRQVILIILLCIMVFAGRAWFSPLEFLTIVVFLLPVTIAFSVKVYRRFSVAGFRSVVPAVLVCSFSFMAQKSISELKNGEKITFTDAGIIGTFGSYFEDISRVTMISDCGGSHSELTQLGTQKITFYQGGIDVTHNVWKGKYHKFSIGARGFLGFESGGVQTDYPHSQTTFGISPYMTMNWQYFGFGVGFSVGQMKIPIKRSSDSYDNDGDIVSPQYINAYFLPSMNLRAGPSDILYAEATFPGLFPSSTPYGLFQAGIGTGLGKTNGTKVGLGYYHNGLYVQMVYPIKNIMVLEAFYGDNLQVAEDAKRVCSLGVYYKFSYKKTSIDTLKHNPGVKFRSPGEFSKLRETAMDIDGNVYYTLALGGQVWMTENLKVTRFRDGSKIPDVTDNNSVEGLQYNWFAVNHTGNLCPAGWHVPSLNEWGSLINSLGGQEIARSKMEGTFSTKGKISQWWSSTEQDNLHAQILYLDNQTVGIMFTGATKTSALSVRCIRN